MGALILRMGFGGIRCSKYNKKPQNPILVIKAPELGSWLHWRSPSVSEMNDSANRPFTLGRINESP